MKPDQPRIALDRTWIDAILDGLAIAGWLSGIAIVLIMWPDLPERLPMHFDVSGQPTRWGPRGELFVLPTISLMTLLGLGVLSRFPHIYNYLVVITPPNARRQYQLAVRLIQSLNLLLQGLFSVIVWIVIRTAQGLPHPGIWIVPLFVGGIFVQLVVYLITSSSEPSSGRSP